jgi:hypothetical protein
MERGPLKVGFAFSLSEEGREGMRHPGLHGVLALALALVGCADRGSKPTAVTLMKALPSCEYRCAMATGGVARLTDGVYVEPAGPDSSTQLTVRLTEFFGLGDLNGDGDVDAAAVLSTDPGGSGTFYDLVAVVSERDGPRHVATASLGDRVLVEAVRVANGWVTVDLLTHDSEDSMSAPSVPLKQTYRLIDDELLMVR